MSSFISDADIGRVWWVCMVFISALNLLVFLPATLLQRSQKTDGSSHESERRLLRAGAAVFTVVCAYRAVLPRIDVPRVCWFDTPLNWVLFGRASATIAEVAWATQMGLTLRRLALNLHGSDLVSATAASRASKLGLSVIAMACTAECCSWTVWTRSIPPNKGGPGCSQ